MTRGLSDPEPLDLPQASEPELARLHELTSAIQREMVPEDRPMPLAVNLASWRHRHPFVRREDWVIRRAEGGVVAHGFASYWLGESNRHLSQAFIGVLPEFRRRGLGRALLARLVGGVRRDRRRLILFNERSSVPAAALALVRYGAEIGLENRLSRLDLCRLDRARLDEFRTKATERARGYALGLWDRSYPEAELAAIAELIQVMNTAPRGGLDVEDGRVTPDQLRAAEHAREAARTETWSFHVRESGSGRLAGLTSVAWNPGRPEIVFQQETLVRQEHRNRGLGRWLKAAMLEKILIERKEARWVETINAESNAAMLKINVELGFRPHQIVRNWQLAVDRAEAYLRG